MADEAKERGRDCGDSGGHAEWGQGPYPKSKEKTLKDSVRKEWYLESC